MASPRKLWTHDAAINRPTPNNASRCFRLTMSRSLLGVQQKRDQVRHLLDADGGLDAFGHEREAGSGESGNVASEYRVGHTLGALEGETGGALLGNKTVKRAAVPGFDRVADEVGRYLAVGIEDIHKHLVGIPRADGGEVRADVP